MLIHHIVDAVLAAPADPTNAPADKPGGGIINTPNIMKILLMGILPPLLGWVGVLTVGRARSGDMGRVMTTVTIALIGIAFVSGAVGLIAAGSHLVDVMFGG